MFRLVLILCVACLSGCNLSYYTQLARGQLDLLMRREPIADILANPGRDAELRRRLAQVQDARRFASQKLALPDNASYKQYAELDRPYVVWNVMAAPAYSVDAYEHCFLIVGCLAYRGYFHEEDAREAAADLQAEGLDSFVSGIPAYSTLGWFADPLLSSMLRWDDAWLIGTLFHELAHQQLYVKNDTAFNESFASFVEEAGLHQYLQDRGLPTQGWEQLKQRQQQFSALMLKTREKLRTVYDSGLPPQDMEARKQEQFTQLQREYEALRDGDWQGWRGYDRWFEGGLNNAKLLPFALYDDWVPAFAALFEQSSRRWPAFYQAAVLLGELDESAREENLQQLKAHAPNPD